MRLGVLAVCGLLVAAPAAAESLHMVGTFPALARELSSVERIAVERFEGRDGGALAQAILRRLAQPDEGQPPHYTIVDEAAPSDAMLSGEVETRIDGDGYTETRSRCAEKREGKCVRREKYTVECQRRSVSVSAQLRGVLTRDGRIVYAVTKPRSDSDSWCEDEGGPGSVTDEVRTMIESIAAEVRTDIAPHTDHYSIRIREGRDGMPKPLTDQFRAAVRLTNRDEAAGCDAFRGLATLMPEHPSLAFNIALCAEASGDHARAADLYRTARSVTQKDAHDIDLGIARTTGLLVAAHDRALRAGLPERL